MKNKNILDYIVITESIESHANLLLRVNKRQEEIDKEWQSLQKWLREHQERLERFKFLHEEYQKYEPGNNYPSLTEKEEREWSRKGNSDIIHSEGRFAHPLKDSKVVDGIAHFNLKGSDKEYLYILYHDAKNNIEKTLQQLEASFEEKKYRLEEISKESNDLELNQDPTTNKNTRTQFERQVFELIQKGYEPTGGIAVSYGFSYQAMIKYED
jgi:hypothetical protein